MQAVPIGQPVLFSKIKAELLISAIPLENNY